MEKRGPKNPNPLPEAEPQPSGPETGPRFRRKSRELNALPQPMEAPPEPPPLKLDSSVEVEHIPTRNERAARERLEQTMIAAELNLPEEARNERRHEIKKQEQVTTDEAASVGQILAQLHEQTTKAHAAYKKPHVTKAVTSRFQATSRPRRLILISFSTVWLALMVVFLLQA